MNAQLQKSFDAVESSLATLITSISQHDPSPGAAEALIAADDDLSASLSQLVTHQTNHQHILHLRALSAALDNELTALLTTLSFTRTSLLPTSANSSFTTSAPVSHDEILAYATKISKYTRRADVKVIPSGDKVGVTEEDVKWIEPPSEVPFTPWPTEADMDRGVLRAMGMGFVNGQIGSEQLKIEEKQEQQPQQQQQMTVVDRDYERRDRRERALVEKKEEPAFTVNLDLYNSDEED